MKKLYPLLLILIVAIFSLPFGEGWGGASFASTYTVTLTADAGAGSLRQAIIDANGNAGQDTIIFNLGAGGPYTITLATALPDLTDNAGVIIDGFSNTGASANTIPVFNKNDLYLGNKSETIT